MLFLIFAVFHVGELLDHVVVQLNLLLVMLEFLLQGGHLLGSESTGFGALPQLVELLVFEQAFVDIILILHLSLVRLMMLVILGLFRFIDIDDFKQIVC